MTWRERERFLDVVERVAVEAAEVPALRGIGLERVGFSRVGPRWEFVRPAPEFGVVLVTLAGNGEGLLAGEWTPLAPETAYVAPAGAPHGYRTARGAATWHYGWAIAESSASRRPPFAGLREPVVLPAASYAVQAAIDGLLTESRRANDPTLLAPWAQLLRSALERLRRPATRDPRITRLWAVVAERLAERWDLAQLAATAHLSREHLRRLCQRDEGCSPHQRLAALRLERAAEWLRLTDAKLATIAEAVGFSDAFALSRAFKRAHGVAPAVYRERRRTGGGIA